MNENFIGEFLENNFSTHILIDKKKKTVKSPDGVKFTPP